MFGGVGISIFSYLTGKRKIFFLETKLGAGGGTYCGAKCLIASVVWFAFGHDWAMLG